MKITKRNLLVGNGNEPVKKETIDKVTGRVFNTTKQPKRVN